MEKHVKFGGLKVVPFVHHNLFTRSERSSKSPWCTAEAKLSQLSARVYLDLSKASIEMLLRYGAFNVSFI